MIVDHADCCFIMSHTNITYFLGVHLLGLGDFSPWLQGKSTHQSMICLGPSCLLVPISQLPGFISSFYQLPGFISSTSWFPFINFLVSFINFLVSFHHFIPSMVAWDVIYQSSWGGVSFRLRSGGSNQKLSAETLSHGWSAWLSLRLGKGPRVSWL